MINRLSLLACLFYLPVFSMAPSDLIDRDADFRAEEREKLFYKTAEKRLANKENLDEPIAQGDITLLHYFSGKDLDLVKKLLEAGAKPTSQHLAFLASSPFKSLEIQCAEELLKHGLDPNEAYGDRTALYRLSTANLMVTPQDLIRFVELLLHKGAIVNMYSKYPITATDFLELTPLYQPIFQPWFYTLTPQEKQVRKNLIHKLIFHGAHLLTIKDDPRSPVKYAQDEKRDPDIMDLAKYAEEKYVLRMLQLLYKSKEPNTIKNMPKDILQYIADRC